MFEDIFSVPLSQGTVVAASKRCAEALSGFEDWMIGKIKKSRVVDFDGWVRMPKVNNRTR